MSHEISLSYGCARKGLPARASLLRWVAAAAGAAGVTDALSVSFRFVDSDEGRDLNRSFRGKDYATNVLSFPADLPAFEHLRFLGDIALCVPVLAREAAEQDKSDRHHVAHLCIHGVLHLLGYDHENDHDAAHMEALEIRALASLGIGNPYESSKSAIEQSAMLES